MAIFSKIVHVAFFLALFTFVFSELVSAVPPVEFQTPPDSARPWVYFFIMDGNLTHEGITADLEAMKEQGIGGLILMEVNVGVPRGKVDFMSEEWQKLFAHLIHEAERLGLQVGLSSGPGWAGSGGPWIAPEQSMLHLVASEKNVQGPVTFNEALPIPQPRVPFFGEGQLPTPIEKARKEFFKDVRVLAFQKPHDSSRISNIDEKAGYYRAPYSSAPNVKPRIPAPATFDAIAAENTIDPAQMVDLTEFLDDSGVLKWDVPEGEWTILRFAATSTGANTRPAPDPAFGLESSKIDREYFDLHAKNYIDKLIAAVGERRKDGQAGWCFFHLDSWEMGPQNYSNHFFAEFKQRRGYDPMPFLPAYLGFVVQSREKTERFLWDIRQTMQELIVENHAMYLKEYSHQQGLKFSNEPYDMMPCCDMTFGAIADVPMCEFWCSPFDTAFSVFEAASTAHTNTRDVVAAEAFTSMSDGWRQNPKTMKLRGDWAFCSGVNRFVFHRYQHQPYLDKWPGFSMGDIGIHWERTQTWWPLIGEYHKYLARCQHILQQGVAVVDVLYLLPEGAPQVFTPPQSALIVSGLIKDQRGYRFDACEPVTFLNRASVKNGEIVFPGGTKYKILVLPNMETMTLPMLQKIESLVEQGATVVGNPPKQSPSLQNYPQADKDIQTLAAKMWQTPQRGKGRIIALPKAHSEPPMTFDGAQWMWYPEGNPAYDAPAGTRYFRKTFVIPEGHDILNAKLIGVADNHLTVKVNGRIVHTIGLGLPVKQSRFEIMLKIGENLVEMEATNSPSNLRNPAGLVAKFEIVTLDPVSKAESHIHFSSGEQWESSKDNATWENAMVLGNFGMGPWSVPRTAAETADDIYPEYDITAKILADMGIPTDCNAPEKGLRFFHRQKGQTDYYFVGNRSETPFNDEVSFRVTGKKASIFDPITGRIFKSPQLTEKNGQTVFTLELDGSQSVFVVFDSQETDSNALPWQRRPLDLLLDISGDWKVRFDSNRGGPIDPVDFPQLADWSASAIDGVKHYSGIVVYEKDFFLNNTSSSDQRIWLDLGNVEVMAKVKLNGKTIGTRWIAPYRFDVTEHLKNGQNKLEIEVANLWPNRLIGDANLPAEKRVTWTTFGNAYNANSPLMPSGLFGPVKVLKEKK